MSDLRKTSLTTARRVDTKLMPATCDPERVLQQKFPEHPDEIRLAAEKLLSQSPWWFKREFPE
jgi:hypothetical protein